MEEFQLEDGSNDKAYFTMVPNIVLNHSSAVDQALYLQMKRFAGEKNGGGYCTASHRTLMGKLKIGPKALKTSLQYLLDHKWIDNVGSRKVMTEGGAQDVQIYRVNDIWRMNVEHYKGANESAPLHEGGDERKQGADERSKGGDESAPTKNYKTYKTLGGETPQLVKVEDEETPKKEGRAKYPHSKEVFGWFPKPQRAWEINSTELKHAELLYERGEKQVRAALKVVEEHGDDSYCPVILKPSHLEQKWANLLKFSRKHV